ncbi:MAG: hypothetical protein ACU0DI_15610, partial [Paracoccaceae bacterium]
MRSVCWSGVFLVAALVLSACGRPLAEGERALAHDVFGAGLELGDIRVAAGLGLAAPPAQTAPRPGQRIHRPGACARDAPDPKRGPPPAFAAYQTMHVTRRFYAPDMAAGWPDAAPLPEALILVHELGHVWQWQNRARTRYAPLRAALESLFNADPYFYDPADGKSFLDYSFEQQAALIEDYLCYALVDARAPHRAELRAILAPHFPVARLDAA